MKRLKLLIIAALLLALGVADPAAAVHNSKISGYKWHDQNADGVWDAGEPPLEGWTINLGGADQWYRPVSLSTTTDVDGYYEFYPLWAGNYIVSETLMPGWLQSYPAAPGTYVIALLAHQEKTDNNFGNYQSAQSAIELTKTATESYSKAGDVIHYTITVKNTSPEDTPDLVGTITDPMLGINQPVTLAWNDPDYVINTNYTVLASDPDPLVNTATVTCSPVGDLSTVLTVSDSASVDILHPAFTLAKTCAEEPVLFGDDAVFNIALANTGDVDLVVVLDEDVVDTLGVIVAAGGTISASVPFALPVGQTLQATVAIPATTYPTQNTINAHITLPEWTGLDNYWDPAASDSCDVVDTILPGFTLTKVCAEEPVLLGDDAVFNIELANTGNVDLIVVLDEDVVDTLGVIVTAGGTISAGAQFTLPVGQTLQATVAIPATTYPFESNTINAHITLPESTGRTDSWDPTATDSCDVIAMCSRETAYGLNDALSPVCFNTLGFDNWGWTHGPLLYSGVYKFDLWAGAAHCDTDNGTYAGTVTIDYTGNGAKGYSITYDLEEGFEIVEEHVYIGRDQLPKIKEGNKTIPTVAPGQYYVTRGMHSDIYIIYHAMVEWCE